MSRKPLPPPTPPECKDTLGLSPAVLAKRDFPKDLWSPKAPNNEYDRYCDPHHPKTIYYDQVMKAHETLKHFIPVTPLRKSRICAKFGMNLYFKIETGHPTGSFHERSAMYALLKLTPEQRSDGVYTASTGNWAMALAHQGLQLNVEVTVVLPVYTRTAVVSQCQRFRANVLVHGKNIDEAKTRAFKLIAEHGRVGTYLNGYDHPNVIAAAGCIGIEILNQLPDTDAILIPVGGGGLLAGISTFAKHIKPDILIYGIEPGKSCSFAKALDNERPYRTGAERSLATSLTVPKAGENAFHTAQSHIDKLMLVHDNWTARAILHLIEEESIVAEGAGAISLGALLCIPDVLPELRSKNVVCVISGGNIDLWHIDRAILYGKAAEGRMFAMTIRVTQGKHDRRNKILKFFKYMKCNVTFCEAERPWLAEGGLLDDELNIICETKDVKQSTTIQNVLQKVFPKNCEFTSDFLKPKTRCACYPKILY